MDKCCSGCGCEPEEAQVARKLITEEAFVKLLTDVGIPSDVAKVVWEGRPGDVYEDETPQIVATAVVWGTKFGFITAPATNVNDTGNS